MKWRADFPLLTQKIKGKPLIYLDSAASSLKPWPVIERVGHFLTYETANVHRGSHYLSNQATEAYETARKTVAQFLKASSADEIVFTRGTTESINLVAQSWGSKNLKKDDEIVLTEMEHHSNIVPWQLVAEKVGAKIQVIGINDQGELRLEEIESKITFKTKMVAITHCSNVLGTINDLAMVIKKAHSVGARVLVDGAQAVASMPVDLQTLNADFYVFSGHKIFAPYGIGILYGKKELLESMPPYQGGGSMISNVTFEKTTYHDIPFRFEAGTPNIEGALGLGAALQYLTKTPWPEIQAHKKDLMSYAQEKLQTIPGLKILGQPKNQAPVISFAIEGIHASDLAQVLDQENIAIRAGHLCAQPLLKRMKVAAFARISFSVYNEKSDIDGLVKGILKAQELLK